MSCFKQAFKARAQAAFSLVEIILALGVISFAIVAILGMFPVAVRAATESQEETQAALIARGLFEQIATQTGATRKITIGPLDQANVSKTLNLSSPPPQPIELGGFNSDTEQTDAQNARYKVTATIAPATANPATKLAQVTFTIKTPTRSYPFTTLVSYE